MTVSVEKAFRDRYPSTMSTESREAGGSRRFTIYLDPSNNIDRTIIRCIEKLGEDIGTQSILRRALIVGVEALSLGEAPILATDIMNDVARTIVDMHKNLGIDDRSPRKNRRRRSAADAVSEARTAFETLSPSAPIVIPAHHSSGEVEDLPHPNDKGEIPNDVDTRHSSASDAADLILVPDSHPATSSDSTPSKEADNIGQKAPEEPDQTAGDPTSSKISPHIPSDGTAEESEASIQVSKPQTSEEAQSVSEGDSPGVSNIPDTSPPPSGGQKLDPAIEAILRKHKAIDVSSTEAEPHSTVAPLTPPGGRTTIHPIGTSANATQTDPQSAQQRGG